MKRAPRGPCAKGPRKLGCASSRTRTVRSKTSSFFVERVGGTSSLLPRCSAKVTPGGGPTTTMRSASSASIEELLRFVEKRLGLIEEQLVPGVGDEHEPRVGHRRRPFARRVER